MKFAYALLTILAVANAAPFVERQDSDAAAAVTPTIDTSHPAVSASIPTPGLNLQDLLSSLQGTLQSAGLGSVVGDVTSLVESLLSGGEPNIVSLLHILDLPKDQIATIKSATQQVLAQAGSEVPLASQVLEALDKLLDGSGIDGLISAVEGETNGTPSRRGFLLSQLLPKIEDRVQSRLSSLGIPDDKFDQTVEIVRSGIRQLLGRFLGGNAERDIAARQGLNSLSDLKQQLSTQLTSIGLGGGIITSIIGTVESLLGGFVVPILGNLIGNLG